MDRESLKPSEKCTGSINLTQLTSGIFPRGSNGKPDQEIISPVNMFHMGVKKLFVLSIREHSMVRKALGKYAQYWVMITQFLMFDFQWVRTGNTSLPQIYQLCFVCLVQ